MIYPANLNLAITSVARHVSNNAEMRKSVVARISSGSKVEDASVDAGATLVSFKFKTSGVIMDAMQSNMLQATSYLTAQADALKQLEQHLDRMGELVGQMSDTTKTDEDKNNALAEFNQLREEIKRVQDSKFNDMSLFYTEGETGAYNVALNTEGTASINLKQADMTKQGGWVALMGYAPPYQGLEGISDTPANLTDPNGFGGSGFFVGMIQDVASLLGDNASQQNQLKLALDHSRQASQLTQRARDTITELNVADEVTHLSRMDVLTQSGLAMMSQANVAAQSVLKLLHA